MTGFLRSYFSYPTLPTQEATERARTFLRVALGFLGLSSAFLLFMSWLDPGTLERRLVSIGLAAAVIIPLIEVNRRGHTQLAGMLLFAGLVAVVTRASLTSGGIDTPTGYFMIFFVALGGLLFNVRGVVVCAILLVLLGFALLLMGKLGVLPERELYFTPLTTWLYASLCMGGSVLVHREVSISLGRSLHHAQDEVAARRKAQERLRLALDAGELGVWVLDMRDRRFHADRRLFELYAIPPTDDLAVSFEEWLDRIHPDDRAQAQAAAQQMAAGAADVRVQFRVVHPDGSIRHVEASGVREEEGGAGAPLVVGLNRDVTRRCEGEQERERLLHDLGERIKELRLLHSAARLMQNRGLTPQSLFDQIVTQIPPAWQYPEVCEARMCFGDLSASTPGWRPSDWMQSIEFSTSDGDGRIDVAYMEPRPESDEGAFMKEERSVLESLAEMLVNHIGLRNYREGLEALVETRTRQMREARDEAERASRAKGDFLATMSHEIRTPMNAILGYAQLLRRESGLSKTHRERLDSILSSGDHLLTLINNVLDMSRIEAGKTTLSNEPFDLHLLLRDLHKMFAALVAAKSLNLNVRGFASLPRVVSADAGRVRQVVINLLSNALKFTRSGDISLAASCSSSADGHLVSISVTDSGPGIAPEDLSRVFHMFEQTAAGTQVGGSGLGLPIARELARLMGGDLTAQSELGQGSTFTFSFRAGIADEVAMGDSRRVAGIKGGAAPKILVVDDQPDNLTIADETLRAVGFRTHLAMRGDEALLATERWNPDLLLMDVRMPGMSGIEVVRQLRAEGNQVPVVSFTASGLEAMAGEARAAGANEVLYKPCKEQALMAVLGRLLNLEYEYEATDAGVDADPEPTGQTAVLVGLGAGVPKGLLDELLAAAVQARAGRIGQLAEQVAVHAPVAADQVRKLAREFRYDELITALRAATEAKGAD